MKVLGISGSPRKGGNTDILLDEALKGAASKGADVEKVILNDLAFKPCQECGGCDNTGECVLEDDMRAVYRSLDAADAVILASPIFFTSLSAQAKMFVDRFQCMWVKKHLLKKVPPDRRKKRGAFLCVSAVAREDFFENAKRIVKAFFSSAGIEYTAEIYCGGIDKKGSIREKNDVVEKAFRLGLYLCK